MKTSHHPARIAPLLALVALLGSLILGACAAGSPQSAPTPQPTTGAQSPPQPGVSPIPATPAPATLARGYLTTPVELERAAQLAEQGVEPYQTAVAEALKSADAMLAAKRPRLPKQIDIEGDDIEKPPYLSDGSKAAYAWALAYNLLKDRRPSQAQQFALAAHELIMAMPRNDLQVSGYQANTRLNISAYIQNFIYAADLLADWTPPNGAQPFGRSDDARAQALAGRRDHPLPLQRRPPAGQQLGRLGPPDHRSDRRLCR